MSLSRDQILQANDLPLEEISVPEWGGTVYVRGLTGEERDELESSVVHIEGKRKRINTSNIRAHLASLVICDEAGKKLFTEKDIQALGRKCASALQRVFDAAQRLSGLTEEDLEELGKNFVSGQNGASGSG